jgi:hypothetical protein
LRDIHAGAPRFTIVGPSGEKLYSFADRWDAEVEARELAAAEQADRHL